MSYSIPSAADLRSLIETKEAEKARIASEQAQAAAQELRHQKDMFLERRMTPEVAERVMSRVRLAAESGALKLLLGRFPSAWCSDRGRMINNAEDGWPETLPGFAREFYLFWVQELKPKGFHLSAEIVEFDRDGIPGDVAAYLSWLP
jgi:hypothetical protein